MSLCVVLVINIVGYLILFCVRGMLPHMEENIYCSELFVCGFTKFVFAAGGNYLRAWCCWWYIYGFVPTAWLVWDW